MGEMVDTAYEAIRLFYFLNIPVAVCSYTFQQKILIDMLRGKRPLSKDNSLAQWWIFTCANSSTVAYSTFIVRDDTLFILLSAVNAVLSLFSAVLNTCVHRRFDKQQLSNQKEDS